MEKTWGWKEGEGGLGCSLVALHDELCCSALNGLNAVNVLLGVWIPRVCKNEENLKTCKLPPPCFGSILQKSLEDAKRSTGLCAHIGDVFTPVNVFANGNSSIPVAVDSFQCVVIFHYRFLA